MKNKTSPAKFLGALSGLAGAAAGTAATTGSVIGSLGGLFGGGGGQYTGRGRAGWTEGMDLGGASSATIGGQVAGAPPVTDVAGNFNPAAVNAMTGIFGNTNARQASLGGSGMMVLKKHLSPVNQGEELPQMDTTMGGTMPQDTSIEPGDKDYEAQAKDDKTLENLKFTTDKNSLNLTGTYDPEWGSEEDLKAEGYI